MPDRPTAIPAQLTAGDTWTWERSLSDYPASDGWVLSYGIVGQLLLEWDDDWHAADGALHVITIPMAVTADLGSGGSYRFVEYATKAGERYTLRTDVRLVAADPGQFAAGDGVSWARRMLKVCEDFLEGHLEAGVQYQMIGTRQLQHIPLPELRTYMSYLRERIAKERAAGRGPLGRPVRFRLSEAR